MHHRIISTLARSARAFGWEYRGTLEGWEKGLAMSYGALPTFGNRGGSQTDPQPPDICTFWFHLENDENVIIGFDWTREKPNEVRTVNGSLPSTTPINLSYVSSHKKLNAFFEDSKKHYRAKPKKETKATLTENIFTRDIKDLWAGFKKILK
jgi:hypothetical protein